MKKNRLKLFEEFINEQNKSYIYKATQTASGAWTYDEDDVVNLETIDKNDIKQVANELKALGAKVKVERDGIVIDGDWKDKYSPYHEFVTEITGHLTVDEKQDKDFLKNLKTIGGNLNTSKAKQDKDFLRNLETLGQLWPGLLVQDKDFLRSLKTIDELRTPHSIQDKDFLRNLKTLRNLDTSYAVQNKDFLRNLEKLENLYTMYAKQDKDFLRNLKTLGILWTQSSKTKQDEDFLKNTKIKKITD